MTRPFLVAHTHARSKKAGESAMPHGCCRATIAPRRAAGARKAHLRRLHLRRRHHLGQSCVRGRTPGRTAGRSLSRTRNRLPQVRHLPQVSLIHMSDRCLLPMHALTCWPCCSMRKCATATGPILMHATEGVREMRRVLDGRLLPCDMRKMSQSRKNPIFCPDSKRSAGTELR